MTHDNRADSKKRSAAMNSPAAARLSKALKTLIQRDKSDNTPQKTTVTELCQLARVSRNSLYRYHLGVLKILRKHQCRYRADSDPKVGGTSAGNAPLRRDIEKLAALVDHYYAAYREAAALLERRERELSELRRVYNIKPALVRS